MSKQQYNLSKDSEKNSSISQRYVIGILGFTALANAYIQRFSLSLTITEMAAAPIDAYDQHKKMLDHYECPPANQMIANNTTRTFATSSTTQRYEFDWDERTQGIILSSVFWGYVASHLPGGWIAERYGGKHTLGLGMLCSIFSNLITPFVVRRTGSTGMIVARFFVGLGQGPLYPSLNVLLSHWAPHNERGRLGALVFAGAQVGIVISMAVTGVIIEKFDWPSVFYIYGVLGVIWYIIWLIFVSDTPFEHRFISEEEKEYLLKMVTNIAQERKNIPQTPWKKILTSVPVCGVIVAQVGHDWGLFTIITDLPKYMKTVLHFSVAQNGTLSALPYLMMWISALISGVICDWLIEKKGLDVTFVRKIFITIAAGPAIGILGASYSYCNRTAVVISFVAGMGLMGAFVPSLKVNPLDLSPNFCGSLMALVGGIGAISGIFAPYLVGVLTTNGTLLEWRNVFWVAFFILVTTNVIYLFLGSAEVQPWNELNIDLSLSTAEAAKEAHKDANSTPATTVFAINSKDQRKMSVINGMPIDLERRRSVYVERPLI